MLTGVLHHKQTKPRRPVTFTRLQVSRWFVLRHRLRGNPYTFFRQIRGLFSGPLVVGSDRRYARQTAPNCTRLPGLLGMHPRFSGSLPGVKDGNRQFVTPRGKMGTEEIDECRRHWTEHCFCPVCSEHWLKGSRCSKRRTTYVALGESEGSDSQGGCHDRKGTPPLRLSRTLWLLRRGLCRRQGQGLLRDGNGPAGRHTRRRLRLPALPGQAGLPTEGHDPNGQQLTVSVGA